MSDDGGEQTQNQRNTDQAGQDLVDFKVKNQIKRGEDSSRRAAEGRKKIQQAGEMAAGSGIAHQQADRIGRHHARDGGRREKQQSRRQQGTVAP